MSKAPKVSWLEWPQGRAPLLQGPGPAWRAAATDLRKRARAALVHAAALPAEHGLAWCQAVRAANLVAAIAVDAGEVEQWLAASATWGPRLLVVQCGASDRATLGAALASLAATRSPTLRWSALGVPICWLGEAEPDLALLQPLAPEDQRCADCAVRGACPGPQPDQQVAPLPAARSNQFDVVAGAAGAIALEVGGQPARGAVVGEADPAEVAQALARGQLYLDRSDAARIDDFAGQIQLLEQDHAGVWRAAAGQPFDREEAVLQQVIAGLRGLVVDVGAGPVRYLGQLRHALQSGQLRYLAVEPDPQHLARSQAALPQGQFVRGVGEFLPLPNACADAVLWLRSWNHLRDPKRAVAEALRVAKPGATLLAVDNVAFGLVRTPEQLQRAHAIAVAETPFEHFRNDCATEALQTLLQVAGDRLEVVQIQEVEPGTSNQWLLQLRVRSVGRILE